MIHQIEKESEVEAAFAPGGVIEALELAKSRGKIRYVGLPAIAIPTSTSPC